MMELMKEAGLNTILGMGMTFLVLILLSWIITLFGRGINAFQNRGTAEKKAPARSVPVPEPAAAEPEPPKAPAVPGDDDLIAVLTAAVAAYESDTMSPEIAAVIAAAVAAYEGTGNGYVVRRIRKSRRHVA